MNDFDDEPDGDGRGDTVKLARARTAGPGTILFLLGLFGIITGTAATALTQNLGPFADWLRTIEQQQPAGKQKDDMQKNIERIQEADTPEARTVNLFVYGGATLISLLIAIGGWKMRSLGGYTLALVGSILAIVPFNGCCCIATPFGIWGLVTLLNSDVKAGFARIANRGSRDDFDTLDRN